MHFTDTADYRVLPERKKLVINKRYRCCFFAPANGKKKLFTTCCTRNCNCPARFLIERSNNIYDPLTFLGTLYSYSRKAEEKLFAFEIITKFSRTEETAFSNET